MVDALALLHPLPGVVGAGGNGGRGDRGIMIEHAVPQWQYKWPRPCSTLNWAQVDERARLRKG